MLVQHAVAATARTVRAVSPGGFRATGPQPRRDLVLVGADHVACAARTSRPHRNRSTHLSPRSPTDLRRCPLDLLRRAIDRLGVDFHQGYRMTETGGNITFLGPDDHRTGATDRPELLTSAGYPHREVEIGIAAPSGDLLPSGQVGEIRGARHAGDARLLARRCQRPRAVGCTPATWAAPMPDGRLFVVDRLKDIIVTGGENVSSREVEDALSDHPAVDQVAVVAVPDDYWGEAVCARGRPGSGTPSDRRGIDRPRARQDSGFQATAGSTVHRRITADRQREDRQGAGSRLRARRRPERRRELVAERPRSGSVPEYGWLPAADVDRRSFRTRGGSPGHRGPPAW